MKQKKTKSPTLTAFINNISGEYFEAYVLNQEEIDGKLFYQLRLPNQHARIVKMAASALKKTKLAR